MDKYKHVKHVIKYVETQSLSTSKQYKNVVDCQYYR